MSAPVIVWFRRDLRLDDHSALSSALATGAPILPLFIFDPTLLQTAHSAAPRLQFLLDALQALDARLQTFGARLIMRHGTPESVLRTLIDQTQAQALYLNVDYTPYARRRDAQLSAALNIPVHAYDDAVLLPPERVLKADGTPYKVFTPYKNAWNQHTKPSVHHDELHPSAFYRAESLTSEPLPTLADLGAHPTQIQLPASESHAHSALARFMRYAIASYDTGRDTLPINPFSAPAPLGSSYLSPYLRLGILSPRQAYASARQAYSQTNDDSARQSIATWVSELTWREFYVQILYHYPHVLKRDFVDSYASLAWRDAPDELHAWQTGMTGYPIVDAPMRQLNAIGWMPNRARMIVASFLTKHLLIHWSHGERYFMQRLLDGDPAANNGGWQWSAGTGTDAQPYYRIFNPILQSQKFATPDYLQAWLPELRSWIERDPRRLKHIHAPWQDSLPPKDYPRPIVDHAFARERALSAFKAARAE